MNAALRAAELECWIGKRVRIQAIKPMGSARRLHGLTGTVTGPHPIADGWLCIWLDENATTPHRDWTAPADRLVLLATES